MKQKNIRTKETPIPLSIKDGVLRIGRQLVLRCIADQPLAFRRESDVRWRDAVSLVVGDDLHASVLVDADAGVGGAQIDADDRSEVVAFTAFRLLRVCEPVSRQNHGQKSIAKDQDGDGGKSGGEPPARNRRSRLHGDGLCDDRFVVDVEN